MVPAINRPMLVAQSVDETASTGVDLAVLGVEDSAHYVSWATGVTSGVVEIETADDPAYAGTWAPIVTVTFSGTAPKQDVSRVHGPYKAVRHRISTVVAGGASPSVSTRIVGSR